MSHGTPEYFRAVDIPLHSPSLEDLEEDRTRFEAETDALAMADENQLGWPFPNITIAWCSDGESLPCHGWHKNAGAFGNRT
jgi:hypothetical protein